ncbi:MAG: dienelactone hydrolase family protein [Acidimicrobiales bacterium]|jgi:carboxymethylenebutenolidase
MGEMIEFPSNGSVGRGYLAAASGGGPGVVVIQEWWGLVPHIKDVCERFASAGFTALAPDLYRGKQVSEPDEAGKAAMAMEADVAGRDMSGAVDELLKHVKGDKVAVVGFCMGGGLALTLATRRPDAVSVCVPFYGIALRPDLQPDYSKLEAAVLGHYAELDEYCTPDAARALEARLRGLGREAEIYIYPGTDHAFFNDTRPEVHNAEASALAWERTLDFMRSHLG